jgi:hypothetical protein
MIKPASIALATLGLSALSLNKPASAGVVVGVGLPVPSATIGVGVPAVTPAAAVYPYVYAGGPYYAAWRYGHPYGYFGYRHGWRSGFGWHRGYVGGHVVRGWHR